MPRKYKRKSDVVLRHISWTEDSLAVSFKEQDKKQKDRIFNINDPSVQFNNKPGKVLAKKAARAVKSLTLGEKEETITVLACCNAISNFLPPVLIIKVVSKTDRSTFLATTRAVFVESTLLST
ncbi:hypothetical protein PV327_008084 [Microctonus hyperodae]|uniref:Uncharacterized protein n=1 Tax=Microctonus hyperodae TaxID=165561 RepID=A0AA39KGH7_MICHY|nr:hypothetical protein PV327_008084 [Microctonus hyperodae]